MKDSHGHWLTHMNENVPLKGTPLLVILSAAKNLAVWYRGDSSLRSDAMSFYAQKSHGICCAYA